MVSFPSFNNYSFRHQGMVLFWLSGQIVTILGCANDHPVSVTDLAQKQPETEGKPTGAAASGETWFTKQAWAEGCGLQP